MLFAKDFNDRRVHIDETKSNQEYYCPSCGAPLITKKGDVRQHHFAHSAKHQCTDTWERNNGYDMSLWHNGWQEQFPYDNQEIKLSLGKTTHRADVIIDRTVVEFQHSMMSSQAFDDRNSFYFNLGYKVIWLFDLSDVFASGDLSCREGDGGLNISWKNPKKAFNSYDVKCGCIDLFFQLSENADNQIIKVLDVSASGFEEFSSSRFMSKTDFLEYVGLRDGKCALPYRDDIEKNRIYTEFCNKYSVSLNKQQERAVQTVNGSNLLLAVPGSGKTTVLVARIGHMVINLGIAPESILAITFNKTASIEMADRFRKQFGASIGHKIKFSTINALSLDIYKRYCGKRNMNPREQVEETEKRKIIIRVLQDYHKRYPDENEIHDLDQAIGYIKNMMIPDDMLPEFDAHYPGLSKLVLDYRSHLKNDDKINRKMDFDDQMVFAHECLKRDPELLSYYRSKYKYILVDEAQDTSRIQHEIIRLISKGNNLFMVGDEDQSIYGFRGAYPKALLNFRYDYKNPYIMRMERNYRSTEQIVEKAQLFITKNKGRYEKNMTAERGAGDEVRLINVTNREAQFKKLLEMVRTRTSETAILYRNNESVVVLVDMFLRNDIPFKLREPVMRFFNTSVVRDILAFMKLSINENDYNSFDRICHKKVLYLKEQQKKYVISNCKYKKMSVFDALENQMQYVKMRYRDRASEFKAFEQLIASSTPANAISIILNNGYREYLNENNFSYDSIEILKMLAQHEQDINSFLERINYLQSVMEKDFYSRDKNPVILSTIHSSKGKEYEDVYLLDVYDDRFPSSRPNFFDRSKDNSDGEQEERRLFYVGLTRAKNRLNLFKIANLPSSFVSEIFPENSQQMQRGSGFGEPISATQNRQAETCKEEVLKIVYQQKYKALDHHKRHWLICEKCGEVKLESEFSYYGGSNRVNIGLCRDCARKSAYY